jgi:hypothetical protein
MIGDRHDKDKDWETGCAMVLSRPAIRHHQGALPYLALPQKRKQKIAMQIERISVDERHLGTEHVTIAGTVNPAIGIMSLPVRDEIAHELHLAMGRGAVVWVGVAVVAGDGIIILQPMETAANPVGAGIKFDAAIVILRVPKADDAVPAFLGLCGVDCRRADKQDGQQPYAYVMRHCPHTLTHKITLNTEA